MGERRSRPVQRTSRSLEFLDRNRLFLDGLLAPARLPDRAHAARELREDPDWLLERLRVDARLVPRL